MSKPNINIPAEFASNGVKTPFSNAKVQNGFDRINPDVFAGDNLNQFIDDTYKGLNGVLELYEGCVLYDSTVTYTNKSLVFNITNDKIELYHSLQNNNVGNPLTDTDYWEEVNLGGSTRNVGEVITSTLPLTDAGLHLLDGTLLQYGIYQEFIDYIADLYAENPTANYFTDETTWQNSVTTYGSCGKFVYDSVSKTVRLPKVSNILQGTTDINALGDLIEAGLPNITGTFYSMSKTVDGAFSVIGGTGTYAGTNNSYYRKSFDASRSSSIYGNSTTVQPQTIKAFVYIVVANSTKTSIQVDIDEIATDLNGKADVSLSNVNDTGTSTGAGWAMPSDTYIDLTLGATGSTYTAPANGFIALSLTSDSDGAELWLSAISASNEYLACSSSHSNTANQGLDAYLQVKKNQSFEVGYLRCKSLGSRASDRFRFIYAQGAESEAN